MNLFISMRSGSYMRSPEALYKKLNLLGEICFDLITSCQYERTCIMYLSEFLYPSHGILGAISIRSICLYRYILYAFDYLTFRLSGSHPRMVTDLSLACKVISKPR